MIPFPLGKKLMVVGEVDKLTECLVGCTLSNRRNNLILLRRVAAVVAF